MFIFGKVLGALIGLGFVPPFGLILGLLLGHLFDLQQQRRYFETLSDRSTGPIFQDTDSFIPLVYTLYGRITALSGGPTQAQVQYLERILDQNFGLFFYDRDAAVQAFNQALQPPSGGTATPEAAAQTLVNSYFLDQHTLLSIFRTCLELAALNVPPRPGTQETLARVAGIFGFRFQSSRPQDYTDSRHTADDYEVLGLRTDTPDEEVKKRYRTLARQYHPDALAHLPDGDPKKKQAETQFIKIREAYDRIKARRGF